VIGMVWTNILGITLEAVSHKLAECFGKYPIQLRRGVLGNQEQNLRERKWVSCRLAAQRNDQTFIGCNSAYGGSPLASSIAVIPRLQMSAL